LLFVEGMGDLGPSPGLQKVLSKSCLLRVSFVSLDTIKNNNGYAYKKDLSL